MLFLTVASMHAADRLEHSWGTADVYSVYVHVTVPWPSIVYTFISQEASTVKAGSDGTRRQNVLNDNNSCTQRKARQ